MKKLAAMVLACLMLAGVLSGCAGTANNEDVEYRWKMALNSTEGDNAYDTGVLFAQKIKDLTNGRVRVDLYGGAQLGTTAEVLEVTKPDGSKESMTADAIIVATGSVNAQPPIPGLKENSNCIDSTGALSLEKLPATMVVIGGGVIGLELACAYAAFGTKITVVEAMDHMLPMLDGDLTKIGVAHMKKMGMEFHLECPVQSVEDSPVGAKVVCKDKTGNTVTISGSISFF